MDPFRFNSELFGVRTDVMQHLRENGFDEISQYSSVNPIQDEYGIEVCGIHKEEHAVAIRELLIGMFPSWTPG